MKKYILFSLLLYSLTISAQQYPLFTNYVLNNFGFNPAIAGTEKFIDAKLTYRTQWVGIDDAPKTQIFNFHAPIKKIPIGLGGMVYNDVAGQIKRTGVSAALSYQLTMAKSSLSIGVSGGYYNLRLNEEYLAKHLNDPTLMMGMESNWRPDVNVGLYFRTEKGLFAGVSSPQFLKNEFNFEDLPDNETADFVPHYYGMLGYQFKLSEKMKLEPSALFKYTPDAPLQIDFNARAIFNNKYWFGASFRSEDAISAMLGFDLNKNVNLAYAYDYTLSDLNNGSKGSHEIILGLRLFPKSKEDTDGDGILDVDDQCPLVPGTLKNMGCPDEKVDPETEEDEEDPEGDDDGDGVLNKDDECPKVKGIIDNKGCPFGDRDLDGLRDDIDECPDIPGLAENKGCPLQDRDKDGIIDEKDNCPDEPGSLKMGGCPYTDSDGDGVPDGEDECPNVAGKDGTGCPKVTKNERKILELAIRNLYFDTDKDVIRSKSYQYLDRLAEVMVNHPTWKISMTGHADSRGSEAYNLDLSKRRVNAAKFYLINRGVKEAQLLTDYFGENAPAESNSSESNMQLNRRVEMEFVFD